MITFAHFLSGAVLAVTLLSAAPDTGWASSILVDKGAYTYDPSTHLDWLDTTATTNLSFADIINNVGVSYVNEGWRYATVTDLRHFFIDGGVPTADLVSDSFFHAGSYSNPSETDFVNAVSALGGLLGWTDVASTPSGATNYIITGLFGTTQPDGFINMGLDNVNFQAVLGSVITPVGAQFKLPTWGSFLVRDANLVVTPLPGADLLFASALSLLGLISWRRRAF